jgi:hypothetical protein
MLDAGSAGVLEKTVSAWRDESASIQHPVSLQHPTLIQHRHCQHPVSSIEYPKNALPVST